MQEIWKFPILRNDQSISKEDKIEHLVESNSKDLGIMLSYYFKSEGAVVEKVEISKGPFFLSEHAGHVILKFHVVHFNACLNIHEQAQQEMQVDFAIDNDEVTFKGPYIAERGRDEI
ncbi:hypothetical protein SAMN06295967_11049 [Belliella buryatensis]|uniref:Uncharacterized protein n=1 Tax=Belliella buryatensis TaxID=1500549 RepID=A0A239EPN5_9BACT|nr:hypothetical protein [Belliella buryatensis]SNS46371.1 hypothetical protein SAMN06295967_11049 [Belliella buryatensis]